MVRLVVFMTSTLKGKFFNFTQERMFDNMMLRSMEGR